jgi:hypothetical protein
MIIPIILAIPFFIFAIILFSYGNFPIAVVFIFLDVIFLMAMKKLRDRNR